MNKHRLIFYALGFLSACILIIIIGRFSLIDEVFAKEVSKDSFNASEVTPVHSKRPYTTDDNFQDLDAMSINEKSQSNRSQLGQTKKLTETPGEELTSEKLKKKKQEMSSSQSASSSTGYLMRNETCRFSVSVIPIELDEFLNSDVPQLKGFPTLITNKTDNSIYDHFRKLGHRVVQIYRAGYQPSEANKNTIAIFHSEREERGAEFIKEFCMPQPEEGKEFAKDSDELEINVLLTFVKNGQESIEGRSKINVTMEAYYVSPDEPEGFFWNNEQKFKIFHRSKDLDLDISSPQKVPIIIDNAVSEFINDYNENNFKCE